MIRLVEFESHFLNRNSVLAELVGRRAPVLTAALAADANADAAHQFAAPQRGGPPRPVLGVGTRARTATDLPLPIDGVPGLIRRIRGALIRCICRRQVCTICSKFRNLTIL